MSLESNRKSSTCKYLPRFDPWSRYLTTSAVYQIFTNLPKEPELRDLSHKDNCKKLPYFEDCWFSQKVLERQISRWKENSSKTGTNPEKTCWISLKWFLSWCGKSILYLTSSTWPGEGKLDIGTVWVVLHYTTSDKALNEQKKLSCPFQHLLITLWPGSQPIFMLTCRITLSERGILNLKFRNESRQACQWYESLHKAVRIFWPKLETLKPPSTIQKVVFNFCFHIDSAS